MVEPISYGFPTQFVADEGYDPFSESVVLTVDSVITCYGYDELPAIPESDDVKSGVIALDSGALYVLGYDYSGRTNRWYDTGVSAAFGSEIAVRATFAYSNYQNTVTYSLNGKTTRPIPLWGSDVVAVEYAGYGKVDELSGEYAPAPKKVRVIMPSLADIEVFIDSVNTFAYPGSVITLWFAAKRGVISRDRAKYRVKADGSLEFADTGKPPFVVEAGDLLYPEFVWGESDEVKSRYDAWSGAYGVSSDDATEESYLLDCDPTEFAAAAARFVIVGIRKEKSDWVVKVTGDKGAGDRYGNGYVHVRSVKDAIAGAAAEGGDFFQAEVKMSPP